MGLLDIFKRHSPLPTELPEALIEAAYRQDSKTLARLCTLHRDEILRSFPVWRTVPAQLRSDAAAQSRYCTGLIAIASFFETAGDSSLIQLLIGDDADNPVVLWERDLAQAQALMDCGRTTEAVELLHAVLERTRGLTGEAVAAYQPKTLGSLGAAYFRAGDKARAIQFTEQALEMCRQYGDDEGVRIYIGNIQHINNAA